MLAAATAVIIVAVLMIQCIDLQSYRTLNMTLTPLCVINACEPVIPYRQIPFDCAKPDRSFQGRESLCLSLYPQYPTEFSIDLVPSMFVEHGQMRCLQV